MGCMGQGSRCGYCEGESQSTPASAANAPEMSHVKGTSRGHHQPGFLPQNEKKDETDQRRRRAPREGSLTSKLTS
eukprot:1158534-Pelagomonas_calceolata.AAC.6